MEKKDKLIKNSPECPSIQCTWDDFVSGNNKPDQYKIGIDTFQRMRANATFEEAMGFIRWNIDKYNTRKKGQSLEDYKKVVAYCNEATWWIENREEVKHGCGQCGGKTVFIRGRYPKEKKREVCPTCVMEKMEEIEFQNSDHTNKSS